MRTTFQSNNSYQSSSQNQGAAQRTTIINTNADLNIENELFLRYANANTADAIVISGNSDYGILSALRDSILKLKADYFSRAGSVSIKAEERDDFDKRFLLFEHELDGLLRRRIEYSSKDYEGGTRNLDFTSLLNEK